MEVCPFWKNNTKQGNPEQMETNLLSWTWSERDQAHVQAPATDFWATSSKLLLPPILGSLSCKMGARSPHTQGCHQGQWDVKGHCNVCLHGTKVKR